MKTFSLLNIFSLSFALIVNYIKSINDYVVKTDDENIEILLEKDVDKVKFQKAVDDLLKANEKSREVNIKNRNITISI